MVWWRAGRAGACLGVGAGLAQLGRACCLAGPSPGRWQHPPHHGCHAPQVPGSSTACVAALRAGGLLEVASLGDSGLRVVRGGRVVFRSQVQEHAWNMPYQLAWPEALPDTDRARDAAVARVQLARGDVLVLGTDGVFDNAWEEQLVGLVAEAEARAGAGVAVPAGAGRGAQAQAPGLDVAALAQGMAAAAFANAGDREFRSPWAVEAALAGQASLLRTLFPRGGKMDDCTVVVALVV